MPADLPLVYATTVEARHLDRFRHVNVMWYTHFFDEATLALFERLGCGPSYYARSGQAMFALQQHTRYLRELREGERIEVRARVLGAAAKRIHFMLFLSSVEEGTLSATSELLGTHVDLASRRSSPFPADVSASIASLAREHGTLGWPAPLCGSIKV